MYPSKNKMNTISKFFAIVGDIMARRVGIIIFVLATAVNMAIILINVVAFGTLGVFIVTIILSVIAVFLGMTPVVWAIIMLVKKVEPSRKNTGENIAMGVAYNTLNASVGVWLGGITIWAGIVARCVCDYCICAIYDDCRCLDTFVDLVDPRVVMSGVVIILAAVSVVYGIFAMSRLYKQRSDNDKGSGDTRT